MPLLLRQLLPPLIVAVALTAAVLAASARHPSIHRWAGAWAVGGGYVCGHALTAGRWPLFPPIDTTHWLLYFALATMIIALLDMFVPRSGTVWRFIGSTAFSAAFLAALLQPKFRFGWSRVEGLIWLTGLLIVMLSFSWCFRRIAQRPSGDATLPLVVSIVCGGSSTALLLSGSLLLGQLAMILATTSLTASVVGWAIRSNSIGQGAVPIVAILLTGLCLSGYFYADLPASSACLLASAPAFALVPFEKQLPISRWAPWLQTALVLVAVATAVGLALRASPPLDY